ncbi:MAG: hypothetical protein ACF8TS_21550, partial [Maioricimonas sp. JB049]
PTRDVARPTDNISQNGSPAMRHSLRPCMANGAKRDLLPQPIEPRRGRVACGDTTLRPLAHSPIGYCQTCVAAKNPLADRNVRSIAEETYAVSSSGGLPFLF